MMMCFMAPRATEVLGLLFCAHANPDHGLQVNLLCGMPRIKEASSDSRDMNTGVLDVVELFAGVADA